MTEAWASVAAFAGEAGDDGVSGREEHRAARRQAVLRTAARLFNARGFDRTKLEDIAAELSVSKRTLYYYVRNKEDILFQINKAAYDSLEPALTACADGAVSGLERIRIFLTAYAKLLSGEFGASIVLNRHHVLDPDSQRVLREDWRRLDLMLRELVRVGIADGSIAPCDPKHVAAALYGAFNWLPYWRQPENRPSYEEIAGDYLSLFFHGLAPRDATRVASAGAGETG